jgi:hypothetical protein
MLSSSAEGPRKREVRLVPVARREWPGQVQSPEWHRTLRYRIVLVFVVRLKGPGSKNRGVRVRLGRRKMSFSSGSRKTFQGLQVGMTAGGAVSTSNGEPHIQQFGILLF